MEVFRHNSPHQEGTMRMHQEDDLNEVLVEVINVFSAYGDATHLPTDVGIIDDCIYNIGSSNGGPCATVRLVRLDGRDALEFIGHPGDPNRMLQEHREATSEGLISWLKERFDYCFFGLAAI